MEAQVSGRRDGARGEEGIGELEEGIGELEEGIGPTVEAFVS